MEHSCDGWHASWFGDTLRGTNTQVKTRNADVVVVGAGIIGLFCAWFLTRRGLRVVVLERKTPGAGSSLRNGGGVRSQWGTATNIQLSVLSEPFWAEFEDRFGVDVALRRIGYLFLARTTDALAELSRQVALQRDFGVPSEILSASDIGTRWPSLDGFDVTGASFCASDGFLNQHRVVHALTVAAEAAGATIESGAAVVAMDVAAGRYPRTPEQHPISERTAARMVIVGGAAGAGRMHAPAAGLLATELIVDGGINSIDPGPLRLERLSRPIATAERTGF